MSTRQTDRKLRIRLLSASVSIAIVVSAISIIVAYRIAVDLGQSTELRGLEAQANLYLAQLKDKNVVVAPTSMVNRVLQANAGREDFSPILFRVRMGEVRYSQFEESRSPLDEIELSDEFSFNASGSMSINGERYLWVERSDAELGIGVILARNPKSLDQALGYIAKRLSITAFATFWISVWGALLLSALIIKQVKIHNEELRFLALHDALTALPNRTQLSDQIEQFVRSVSGRAALLMIDLDRFKEVNDTLGHAMGDDLLIELSRRLRSELDDRYMLVRIGGDEFMLWCPGVNEQHALAIASQVIDLCRQPVEVSQTFLELGASIGIAQYPADGATSDALIKSADVAMYQAKKHRSGVKLFCRDDDNRSLRKVKLSRELNSALARREFILYYQPKVDLTTFQVIGVEALARWRHPNEGLVQPFEFIDLVEQSGLVNEFSRYVIDVAVKQIRDWQDCRLDLCVAVNISPFNLADPGLVTAVQRSLEKHGVSAQMLEIELTETAAMLDIQTTKNVFSQLKQLGVITSIDDYGTGMSSLAYLRDLESDYIKIDRSFVMCLNEDRGSEIIVRSTINLIHHLGKQAVAEGIETRVLANKLSSMGCRFGQGHYFSKPLPSDQVAPTVLSLNKQLRNTA